MDKNVLRKNYIKSKLYRYAAWFLAIMGLIVFIGLYFRMMDGNPAMILERPHFLIFMLSPFIPAAVMAYLSERLERQTLEKFEEMMKDQ